MTDGRMHADGVAVGPSVVRVTRACAATLARGRALALGQALMRRHCYITTNPPLAAQARHVIAEIVAETEA